MMIEMVRVIPVFQYTGYSNEELHRIVREMPRFPLPVFIEAGDRNTERFGADPDDSPFTVQIEFDDRRIDVFPGDVVVYVRDEVMHFTDRNDSRGVTVYMARNSEDPW